MKFLDLEGLATYNENLLNKVTTMVDKKADTTHTHTSLKAIGLEGKTISLDDLTLSTGSPNIEHYYCKSDGSGSNITGRPDDSTKRAFSLTVELVRYISSSDYITKQTYIIGTQESTWVRYCISGTWSVWRKVLDTGNYSTYAAKASHTHEIEDINELQSELDGKITNNPFVGSGVSGTAGYIAFAQLKITKNYSNRPIEFELICRGKFTPCYLHVSFSNANSTDPTLNKLYYWGSNYGIFAHKADTSTWLLYHTKSESYDNLTVAKVQAAEQGITITYPGTLITSKPTENVVDAVLGGNINYSESSGSADKVDGYHASEFQKHCDGYIEDFNTTLTDGEYTFGSSGTLNGAPTSGIYGKLIVKVNDGTTHDNSSNWIWQFAYCTNGKNYWRNKVNDSAWSSWRGINDNGTANSLMSTGFGDTNFTYYQTSDEFDGNSGWTHYLIANHGSGETYYHYTIGLPFWSSPIYQRQDGNANKSGWHKFYTTENITYGASELTPGSSSLATGSIYLQYE